MGVKVIDVIFALITGRVIGFVVSDFFKELGIETNFLENVIIWLVFPLVALFCLWVCHVIGRKFLFIFQVAKHVLVGAFATVIDLKLFEFLVWLLALVVSINPLVAKGISFIFSTLIKYWGNKYWAFQKHEKEDMRREIIQFFVITVVGLAIDVFAFYILTKVTGPQFGIRSVLWIKTSVIFAAIIAAVWNFLGYKFLVFKK